MNTNYIHECFFNFYNDRTKQITYFGADGINDNIFIPVSCSDDYKTTYIDQKQTILNINQFANTFYPTLKNLVYLL